MADCASVADLAQAHVLSGGGDSPGKPQASAMVRQLFVLLHGAYGVQFLSKFATGEMDSRGKDKGVRAAMLVWDSGLRDFPEDVVRSAAERFMGQSPEFPPSLPQLQALCRAIVPRLTHAQEHGLPRLMGPVLRREHAPFERHRDGKDWARQHLANHAAGIAVGRFALQSARQAMGVQDEVCCG